MPRVQLIESADTVRKKNGKKRSEMEKEKQLIELEQKLKKRKTQLRAHNGRTNVITEKITRNIQQIERSMDFLKSQM